MAREVRREETFVAEGGGGGGGEIEWQVEEEGE